MPPLAPLVFAGIGYLLLLSCVVWRVRARRLNATIIGVRSFTGTVRGRNRTMYRAVYQYPDSLGRAVQVASPTSLSSPASLRSGESRSLLALSDNPPRVREANNITFECIGVGFLGMGLWMLSRASPPWPTQQLLLIFGGLTLVYFVFSRIARPVPIPSASGSVASNFAPTNDAPASAAPGPPVDALEISSAAPPGAALAGATLRIGMAPYRITAVVLYVIDMALLFAPPSHKTGLPALGGILCVLGFVILVLGFFVAVVNVVLRTVLAAGVALQVSGPAGAPAVSASAAPAPRRLPAWLSHLDHGLWKTALVVLLAAALLMGSEYVNHLR
jgi:hypothetical protein